MLKLIKKKNKFKTKIQETKYKWTSYVASLEEDMNILSCLKNTKRQMNKVDIY